jgi:hypothetical protein
LWVDSAHHLGLHGVGEMSTSLQETGDKQVRITWSTIKLPNGATQDDDNHAGRDPMNLSPYAFSGLSSHKNNRIQLNWIDINCKGWFYNSACKSDPSVNSLLYFSSLYNICIFQVFSTIVYYTIMPTLFCFSTNTNH